MSLLIVVEALSKPCVKEVGGCRSAGFARVLPLKSPSGDVGPWKSLVPIVGVRLMTQHPTSRRPKSELKSLLKEGACRREKEPYEGVIVEATQP